MPNGYHHLGKYKRCQLYTLSRRGESISLIAKELQVHRSTIYRKFRRNHGKRNYCYKQAQEKALKRWRLSNTQKRKMSDSMIAIIEEKLNLQWSPEQISGWLKKKEYKAAVSYETSYKYIWADRKSGGLLYKHLRRNSGKKYNKRGGKGAGRGSIPGRIGISERAEIVEKKTRLCDWKLDTIIGTAGSGAIVLIVERTSKLAKVDRKTAEEVKGALLDRLGEVKEFVVTLTTDQRKRVCLS